jgi:hypothetical protein
MLSARLIRMVEEHWEALAARIVHDVRSDPRLPHFGMIPESELRERTGLILRRLGDWLTYSNQDELAARFENLGRRRYPENVPLNELVLRYMIVKDRMLEFVREQGFSQTAVDIYAAEELEHAVNKFFDNAIYHIVRGYEAAIRDSMERPRPVSAAT